MKKQLAGYTLIEVLLALGGTAVLVGGMAAIVAPAMQSGRDDTLSAVSSMQLSRTSDQLADDITSGQVILRQASSQRLDLLKLDNINLATEIQGHLGNGKEKQIKTQQNIFGQAGARSLVGKDVLLANTSGDYLITKVEGVETLPYGGGYITTFECPLLLPGSLMPYTFTTLNVATTAATGSGGQEDSLYRDAGSGWQLASTGVKAAVFQPAEGQKFGAELAPVDRRINQLMIGLSGSKDVSNLTPALLNPKAWKEWSCGEAPGRPANNLGTLQLNVSLEGNLNPANPGATPEVSAGGPETQSLNRFGTQVFEKLKPGLYNVSANVLNIGGKLYDPVITGSPVNIGNGRAGTVNVNYVERRGSMTITVSGLPAGQKGTIIIQGRENKTLQLENGTYPTELLPGSYTVTGSAAGGYEATITGVTGNTVTVSSGNNTPVGVEYSLGQGTIQLTVGGLDSGEQGRITVSGPQTVTQDLSNGTFQVKLKPGTYTVTAQPVGQKNATVTPAGTVTVSKGATSGVTVQYRGDLPTPKPCNPAVDASCVPTYKTPLNARIGYSSYENTTGWYTYDTVNENGEIKYINPRFSIPFQYKVNKGLIGYAESETSAEVMISESTSSTDGGYDSDGTWWSCFGGCSNTTYLNKNVIASVTLPPNFDREKVIYINPRIKGDLPYNILVGGQLLMTTRSSSFFVNDVDFTKPIDRRYVVIKDQRVDGVLSYSGGRTATVTNNAGIIAIKAKDLIPSGNTGYILFSPAEPSQYETVDSEGRSDFSFLDVNTGTGGSGNMQVNRSVQSARSIVSINLSTD